MTDDVKLVIIGELTNREEATVDRLLKAGLGVAIYRPIVPQKPAATSTVTKPEPEDCKDPISSTSQDKQLREPEHLDSPSLSGSQLPITIVDNPPVEDNSGGSRISHRGGGRAPVRGGMDLQRRHFLVKMYVKTKELGTIGGGMCPAHPLDMPM